MSIAWHDGYMKFDEKKDLQNWRSLLSRVSRFGVAVEVFRYCTKIKITKCSQNPMTSIAALKQIISHSEIALGSTSDCMT
eukprot:1975472-Amphidinium_carterae.1